MTADDNNDNPTPVLPKQSVIDPRVPVLASTIDNTRSAAALELWGAKLEGAVVAIDPCGEGMRRPSTGRPQPESCSSTWTCRTNATVDTSRTRQPTSTRRTTSACLRHFFPKKCQLYRTTLKRSLETLATNNTNGI